MLGGEDPFLFPLVLMGGAGAICAAAHVCTERFVAMIECGLAGKVDDGRAHAEALLPVVQAALRRAEPVGVQGRAPRAGPHPDARRAAAAGERVAGVDRPGARRGRRRHLSRRRTTTAVAGRDSAWYEYGPVPFRIRARPGAPHDQCADPPRPGPFLRTAVVDPRRSSASACS